MPPPSSATAARPGRRRITPGAISFIGSAAAPSRLQRRRCDMALAGQHALITGGGSGIGAAIAVALAQAGATVTICGRRPEPLEATAARQSGIHGETADVTDREAMGDLYKRAEAARGPFGIVVANAGGAQSAPAEKVSAEIWHETLAVNLTGAFYSVQPVLSGMRERGFGRIVFIASTAGLRPAAYVA